MSIENRVPLVRPVLPRLREIEDAVERILGGGILTKGPVLEEFEAASARRLEAKHAIAVSSCTTGLMLAYQAMGLTGEVLVPSFTFMATVSSLVWAGLTPVFAETCWTTMNVDPISIREKITSRTSAIVAVHNFGNPAAIEELESIARRHELQLIFDAAHAFGSSYRDRPIGAQGNVQVFSLSPTKLVIAGEGGIVATDDDELARRIRRGREYGNDGTYDSAFAGLNGRLTEFSSLIGIKSLAVLDLAVENRNSYARYYTDRLSELPGIGFQKVHDRDRSAYKDFCITVETEEVGITRDELADALAAENIDARKYYDPPVHVQTAYRKFAQGELPITDRLQRNCLSIPIWSQMDESTLDRICTVVEKAWLQPKERTRLERRAASKAPSANGHKPYSRMDFLLDHAVPSSRPALERNGHAELTISSPVCLGSVFTTDTTVLVTGAGGSIGSELARQLSRLPIAELVLVDRSEHAAFLIERDLAQIAPDLMIKTAVADISDKAMMESIFGATRPQIVFHAAAHKHVPLMEENVAEAAKNNILGTRAIGEIAGRYEVEKFVLISTDKAVRPISIMGATKRLAEIVVQELDKTYTTRFITVRFGNVIGSTGSVTTLWEEQIKNGRSLTVTDAKMERYFLTIPEAAESVLHSTAIAKGGETFILDMGEPINMLKLAEQFIARAPGSARQETEIILTGARPGEKLREELHSEHEIVRNTPHPKILVVENATAEHPRFSEMLTSIEMMYRDDDHSGIRRLLDQAIPDAKLDREYTSGSSEGGMTATCES